MNNLYIRKFHSFNDIESDWKELLGRASYRSIFQTFEWNESWWRHLRRGAELFLLACYEGERIVGIAPLKMYCSRVRNILSFKILSFVGCPESDYHDFILDSECAGEALNAFIRWLSNNKSEWDILRIPEIPEDSPTNLILEHELKANGFKFKKFRHSTCPYINLPKTFGEYKANLGNSTKRNTANYLNRLKRLGKVEFVKVQGIDVIPQAMEVFFMLNTERWQSVGQTGSFPIEELRTFHKEVAVALAEYLDLCFLELDGKKIACTYSYDFSGNRGLYLPGLDMNYRSYRLGSILILNRIEDAIKNEMACYDFLRGDEEYKLNFAKKVKYNYQYFISHAQLLLMSFLAIEKVEAALRRK